MRYFTWKLEFVLKFQNFKLVCNKIFLLYLSSPKTNNKHQADMSNVFKLQRQSFGDKKVALKSFVNFTREHLQWSPIFIFLKNRTPWWVFSCEFYEIFQNNYFREHLRRIASSWNEIINWLTVTKKKSERRHLTCDRNQFTLHQRSAE